MRERQDRTEQNGDTAMGRTDGDDSSSCGNLNFLLVSVGDADAIQCCLTEGEGSEIERDARRPPSFRESLS